jgi:hypothetical protein
MADILKQNIIIPLKGLHTDNSPEHQVKGTYRFALNAINETEDGDAISLSNEPSNSPCIDKPGYLPLGTCYIGNGENVMFYVSEDEVISEIGILDELCNYEVFVNDEDSPEEQKLKFKVTRQIDCVYRLRRGCERVIYFTDGLNPYRTFNFDKLHKFKTDMYFDAVKFNLFKVQEKTPLFHDISINNGGSLKAGSYNFFIQYLDEDLNPTEFITVSDTIIIYHDSESLDFGAIRGSTNQKNDYYDFGLTNKLITLKLYKPSLDTKYTYYRVAVVEATTGAGVITAIKYSENIALTNNIINYTGTNFPYDGNIADINIGKAVITTGQHIEQIENRLVLGNTESSDVAFCKLQKYASKIQSNLRLKTVILDDHKYNSNPKREVVHTESVGYMPGEIYSFGIVYEIDNHILSPVYHIPGVPENDTSAHLMSLNNSLQHTYYTNKSDCEDYWGTDYKGNILLENNVRHHRFPLRGEINEPLIATSTEGGELISSIYNIVFKSLTLNNFGNYIYDTIYFTLTYYHNNVTHTVNLEIDKDAFFTEKIVVFDLPTEPTNLTIIETGFDTGSGIIYAHILPDGSPDTTRYSVKTENITSYTPIYKTTISKIFGIRFSNIMTNMPEIGNHKITGYYIVQQKRGEDNKTILDNGLLTPLLEENNKGYVGFGHISPNAISGGIGSIDKTSDDIFGLINPEFKFLNKEYREEITSIIPQGLYRGRNVNTVEHIIEDVMPGTSYDTKIHKKREKDGDGYSLNIRFRVTDYNYLIDNINFIEFDPKETFYLNALYNNTVNDSENKTKDVFNLTSDNKVGIVSSSIKQEIQGLVYVTLFRELQDPYSNFNTAPFYRATPIITDLNENDTTDTSVFSGDSYISPFVYVNTFFYDILLKQRTKKSAVLQFTVGILATLSGIATAIVVGPVTGAAIISVGLTLLASGFGRVKLNKVYDELYEDGLRDTADDPPSTNFSDTPDDDEVRWFSDITSPLWIESSINMNWRNGVTCGVPDFLNPFDNNTFSQIKNYLTEKLTILDVGSGGNADSTAETGNTDTYSHGGRLYKGYASAEINELNLDYMRRLEQKPNYIIPDEYDCCSKCIEKFPHRLHWSEQSFQEELTDNYRTFLANNYRDIEGNTGILTDLFTIQNNLYSHTENALWHLPQTIQERVSGDLVTYIGTGNFFNLPPRKIVDDVHNSAGTIHKWATTKTPYGVFFVSEFDKMIYQFNGKSLKPISSLGEFNWFKNNTKIKANEQYNKIHLRNYKYNNNPINPIGTGYISTYDYRHNRIIFTKKDFIFKQDTLWYDTFGEDFDKPIELFYQDGNVIAFVNYDAVFDYMTNDRGYTYMGIEGTQMKFQQVILNLQGEPDIITSYIGGSIVENPIEFNNAWTKSFSLKTNSWISYHSYLPKFYVNNNATFYSFTNNLSKHNLLHSYQTFENIKYPFIVDYISVSNPLLTKTWEALSFFTEAQTYNQSTNSIVENKLKTFNKLILYNTRQCSGKLNLLVKDLDKTNTAFLDTQVIRPPLGSIQIEKVEKNWNLNDIKDVRINWEQPIFNENLAVLQDDYYIDKIVNTSTIDFNKDWTQLETFRDKYLGIRLISDTETGTKLIFKFSTELYKPSFR